MASWLNKLKKVHKHAKMHHILNNLITTPNLNRTEQLRHFPRFAHNPWNLVSFENSKLVKEAKQSSSES